MERENPDQNPDQGNGQQDEERTTRETVTAEREVTEPAEG